MGEEGEGGARGGGEGSSRHSLGAGNKYVDCNEQLLHTPSMCTVCTSVHMCVHVCVVFCVCGFFLCVWVFLCVGFFCVCGLLCVCMCVHVCMCVFSSCSS